MMPRWLKRIYYYLRYGPEEAGLLITLSGDDLKQRIRKLEDPEQWPDSSGVFGLPAFEELLKLEEAMLVNRETALRQIVQKNRLQGKLESLEHRLAELQLDNASDEAQAEVRRMIHEMQPYLRSAEEEIEARKRHVQDFEEATRAEIVRLRAQAMASIAKLDDQWVTNRIKELRVARFEAQKRLRLDKMAQYDKEIKLLEKQLAVTELP
jgi:hypothetical protein